MTALQAIDDPYRAVTRLSEVAGLRRAAGHAHRHPRAAREAALPEGIRQLRATGARMRAPARVTGT